MINALLTRSADGSKVLFNFPMETQGTNIFDSNF